MSSSEGFADGEQECRGVGPSTLRGHALGPYVLVVAKQRVDQSLPIGAHSSRAMGNCCPSLFGKSQPKLAVVTLDPKLHGPAVQTGNFNAKGKGTALANAAIHQVRAR